jgi:hypothetical protein
MRVKFLEDFYPFVGTHRPLFSFLAKKRIEIVLKTIILQEKNNAKRLAVFGNFVDPTNK